jgi:flagellar biogenesis protein FliO
MKPAIKRALLLGFPVLCLGVAWVCLAGGPGSGAPRPSVLPAGDGAAERMNLPGLTGRVFLALALILVLIVAAVSLLKYLGGRTGITPRGPLKVIDRCFLGPKKSLYVVRMGGRGVVVGVTDTGIHPVLELSPEEVDRLYPASPPPGAASGGFSSLLREMATKAVRLKV